MEDLDLRDGLEKLKKEIDVNTYSDDYWSIAYSFLENTRPSMNKYDFLRAFQVTQLNYANQNKEILGFQEAYERSQELLEEILTEHFSEPINKVYIDNQRIQESLKKILFR